MSANSCSIMQAAHLRYQYQQLQLKYKKALQELMHVLQINKTLKQSHPALDTTTLIENQEEMLILRAKIQQMQLAHKQDQQNIINHQRTIQYLSEQNNRISKQLSAQLSASKQTAKQVQDYKYNQQKLISAKYAAERELSDLKRQNLHLTTDCQRRALHEQELQYLSQEIQRAKSEVFQLQEKLIAKEKELEAERAKCRGQIVQTQNYYLNMRREQSEKLKNIESKCMLLESELHNSKTIEQLLQDESRHMRDEQTLFQSFREQIHKINEDWNRLDLQKQQELEHFRTQSQNKSQKIAEMKSQLQKQCQEIDHLKETIKRLEKQAKDKAQLEQRIAQVEAEKSQVLERNHVLEALTVAQVHRSGAQASDRILQFQRRIKLLLEQKCKGGGGVSGMQQVVILKSYIRELSQLLNGYKRREQKLKKSKSVLKMRQKSLQKDYQGQLSVCKKKISDYDTLVAKFYKMLQQKLNEKPDASDQEIRSVINQYEEKMIRMSEQIIQLKNQITELTAMTQEKEDSVNNVSHALQEDERQIHQLKELINQQQFHISGLEAQNRNLLQESNQIHRALEQSEEEAREIFRSKDQIISGLTEENSKLQSGLRQIKKEKQKLKQVIDSYEKEVNDLRVQLETNNKFKSRQNVTDSADLLARIDELNKSVSKLQRDKEELSAQSTQLLKDNVKQYQLKFEAQSQELQSYKAQLEQLSLQIQKERSKKNGSSRSAQILNQQGYRQQIDGLKSKNRQLQASLQDLKKQLEAVEQQYKQQVEALEDQNHEIATQLTHKQAELHEYQQQIRRLQARQQENLMRSTKEIMTQFEDISTQALKKNSKEIDRLNSDILTLKTAKLALENQIKDKDYLISELKHEIYTTSLKIQKQRSSDNLSSENTEIQRLKILLGSAYKEIDSLRVEKEELQKTYGNSLNQHKASLIKIEERQEQLNNAIMNNTSLQGVVNFMKINTQPADQIINNQDNFSKIDLRPKESSFTPEKYKIVQSYDNIPVNQVPKLKPAPKSTQPLITEVHSTNFEKKKTLENGLGSKRSIKMIKMAARPSIELDSPLLPPEKRK